MFRLRSTPLLAAALAMCLSACQSTPDGAKLAGLVRQTIPPPAVRPTAFAPACPTPTLKEASAKIRAELVAAIAAGVPPDALATEWERLDEAARVCRRGQ